MYSPGRFGLPIPKFYLAKAPDGELVEGFPPYSYEFSLLPDENEFPFYGEGEKPDPEERGVGDSYLDLDLQAPYGCFFTSWEEAVNYVCHYVFRRMWFRMERTLFDTTWWQKQKAPVLFLQEFGRPTRERGVRMIDVWTPLPGVEMTWYTPEMWGEYLRKRCPVPEIMNTTIG